MSVDLKQELEHIIKEMKETEDQAVKDLLYCRGKEICYLLNAQEVFINDIKKLFGIKDVRF